MKTNIKQLLIIGASGFLLAGCCTTHHSAQWEYKVVQDAIGRGGANEARAQRWEKNQEALMNDLGKDGWIFVSHSDGILYFKRTAK